MAFGRMSTRQGADTPINSINVTPLVDVMLVLVVIFILAAPMLAASLRVQLPKAQAATQQVPVQGEALVVEVSPQGEIWIQGAVADDVAVQQQLQQLGLRNPQAEVQLRADTSVPYGRVVQVMGWAHAAGLTRIGFVTEPEPKAGSN